MNRHAPTVDSLACPCWWVIKGRQQGVLPPIRRTIYFVYRKNPEYYPILRLFLQELDSLVPSKSL